MGSVSISENRGVTPILRNSPLSWKSEAPDGPSVARRPLGTTTTTSPDAGVAVDGPPASTYRPSCRPPTATAGPARATVAGPRRVIGATGPTAGHRLGSSPIARTAGALATTSATSIVATLASRSRTITPGIAGRDVRRLARRRPSTGHGTPTGPTRLGSPTVAAIATTVGSPSSRGTRDPTSCVTASPPSGLGAAIGSATYRPSCPTAARTATCGRTRRTRIGSTVSTAEGLAPIRRVFRRRGAGRTAATKAPTPTGRPTTATRGRTGLGA